eukprot:1152265-Pelagomonas_calceolata.AAC.2
MEANEWEVGQLVSTPPICSLASASRPLNLVSPSLQGTVSSKVNGGPQCNLVPMGNSVPEARMQLSFAGRALCSHLHSAPQITSLNSEPAKHPIPTIKVLPPLERKVGSALHVQLTAHPELLHARTCEALKGLGRAHGFCLRARLLPVRLDLSRNSHRREVGWAGVLAGGTQLAVCSGHDLHRSMWHVL